MRSPGIGGKRVLSAALKRPGAAKAASKAIAMVFFIISSLNVPGLPPVRAECMYDGAVRSSWGRGTLVVLPPDAAKIAATD